MFDPLEFGDYGHVFYLDTNDNQDEYPQVSKVMFKPFFKGAFRRHCQWYSGNVKYAEEG